MKLPLVQVEQSLAPGPEHVPQVESQAAQVPLLLKVPVGQVLTQVELNSSKVASQAEQPDASQLAQLAPQAVQVPLLL